MYSEHYLNDRTKREEIIQQIGEGQTVAIFIEKGRKYSDLVRVEISSTAIGSFFAMTTNKLITKKILRPNQLRQFFGGNDKVPKDLMELAIKHKRQHLNEF